MTRNPNTWIAGVDGCKAGWFRICLQPETAALRFDIMTCARDIAQSEPFPTAVAIDVPIGLPDSGARACDRAARQVLTIRRNSVFPCPIRPAVVATSYEEACAITYQIDQKRISRQAWGIFPKIKEVDDLLKSQATLRNVFYEVHPEVSFWAWNQSQPMAFAKKKEQGKLDRMRLIEAWLGEGVSSIARGDALKKDLADDDILDAFAALWTAQRLYVNTAQSLPVSGVRDSTGLPMAIHY